MALRAIMLRRNIEAKKEQLAQLRAKDAEFGTRSEEIENAVKEAQTDEEFAAVTAEIERFENEKAAHEEECSRLSGEIADLESQLAEAERGAPKKESAENERSRTAVLSFFIQRHLRFHQTHGGV